MFKVKRRRGRLKKVLALVLLIVIGAITFTAWPFFAYPVTELVIERPDPLPSHNIEVPLAGIAERDITPPIGIPKFGYSAWARESDGFRTRLKARAYYLRSPEGTPIALIAADLSAGSRVLHHRIAELIAAETDVPAHALSLLVTHTHAGPGQVMDSDFYNVFGSNKPGFDPQLAEFLSRQMADAVIEAYRERRPARFASGQRDIYGLTRNRSVEAWARNFSLPEDQVNEALAFRAINPTMTMLRIDLEADDGNYYPAGALTAFSIHGTAIPAFTRPWHGDTFAWFSRDLENAIARDYETPFTPRHGTYVATHGDNNPAWHEGLRGDREARRIGEALGEQAIQLFRSMDEQTEAELSTAVGSRQLELISREREDENGLCRRAIAGAAVVGAAKGDEVFPISWIPPLKSGWPRRVFTGGCQGVKQWMLSKLQLGLPAKRFPHQPVFQVIRINDLVLIPLPWEITLETGNHIREQVKAVLPEHDWQIEIASAANGFFGYAVTPGEYSIQFYEGGHTLYGPGTMDFLGRESARLAGQTLRQGEVDDLPQQWQFSLRSRQYWPQPAATPADRQVLSEPTFLRGTRREEPYWEFRFYGEAPAHMDLSKPLLAMEVNRGDGWRPLESDGVIVNDQGTDMQIKLIAAGENGAEYAVRWYNPLHTGPQQRFRFRVAGEDRQVIYSAAF